MSGVEIVRHALNRETLQTRSSLNPIFPITCILKWERSVVTGSRCATDEWPKFCGSPGGEVWTSPWHCA